MDKSRVIEHRTGRDFAWLVIPASNPTIGIPAYSEDCARNFASRIDRKKDIPEDYLHIPITDHMRARHGLAEPIPAPITVDGWHPFIQVSHAEYLRKRDGSVWAVLTVKHGQRVAYFAARPTYATANRNRLTLAA